MVRTILLAVATALVTGLIAPSAALAVRDQWDIEEVFSNADGTIQFIELINDRDNQQQLAGDSFAVKSEGQTIAEFDFLMDLPSNQTADTSFLMGTQSLADLPDGVTPDYIIPEGFIDTDLADQIMFSFFDTFSLGGLPLDGENSLNRTDGSLPATPTNFSGETGAVPEPSTAVANFSAILCLAALARRSRSATRR